MKQISFDEALDFHFGVKGTPRRDNFEIEAESAIYAYKLGDVITKARIEQNLTQEELGERVGVKKAQIAHRARV